MIALHADTHQHIMNEVHGLPDTSSNLRSESIAALFSATTTINE